MGVVPKAMLEHGPNWSLLQMLALVDTKRNEFSEKVDAIDAVDLVDSNATKENNIFVEVMPQSVDLGFWLQTLI